MSNLGIICVVEDDEFLNMEITDRLRERGYGVIPCRSFREFQEKWSECGFLIDMVLTDRHLPEYICPETEEPQNMGYFGDDILGIARGCNGDSAAVMLMSTNLLNWRQAVNENPEMKDIRTFQKPDNNGRGAVFDYRRLFGDILEVLHGRERKLRPGAEVPSLRCCFG